MAARVIETREMTGEELREWERDQADLQWWQEHSTELVHEHAGKYAAAFEGQLLVGGSIREVLELAHQIAPDRNPCVHHISGGKGKRLYGGWASLQEPSGQTINTTAVKPVERGDTGEEVRKLWLL